MTLPLFQSRLAQLSIFLLSLALLRAAAGATPIALETLVAEIGARNAELQFYEAEIQAAKASVRGAGASTNPELAVQLGRKRVREATGTLAGEGTAWSVSVTQAFEWPGRLALRKAIANGQVELAELGLRRFQLALEARARVLAYGLYAANTRAGAVREVADRFAALRDTFLAREPAGITPQLETRVIEASELTLQRRAGAAELELQAALVELNLLRGVSPGSPLEVEAPRLALGDPPAADALMAAARENNFDFRIRRAELEQQGFEVRLARNERYPAIAVTPFYASERAGEREATVGIGVSLPLPVSGRARSTVEIAESRRRQAETAALVAERELEREVLIAAQVFATKSAEARRWPPDSVRRFRDAAELADRHYRLGAVPIATYVELQNSYLDAVEALLDTEHEAIEAGLKLRQLTGLDLQTVDVPR